MSGSSHDSLMAAEVVAVHCSMTFSMSDLDGMSLRVAGILFTTHSTAAVMLPDTSKIKQVTCLSWDVKPRFCFKGLPPALLIELTDALSEYPGVFPHALHQLTGHADPALHPACCA